MSQQDQFPWAPAAVNGEGLLRGRDPYQEHRRAALSDPMRKLSLPVNFLRILRNLAGLCELPLPCLPQLSVQDLQDVP